MTFGFAELPDSQRKRSASVTPERGCRPFVKWVGGKGQLLFELISRMPDPDTIRVYYEPFLGGGALFFATEPIRASLSDINGELINAYLAVRDSVDQLVRNLRRHKYEQDYFYRIRNIDRTPSFRRWSNVRRAGRLIYLNKTCYNGLFRVNSKGYFNTPFGRYTNPTIADPDNLVACSKALQHADIVQASFEKVVDQARAGDFVYFDPPYMPVSATAYFTNYSEKGFGTHMQQQLYEVCCALDKKRIRFMLSNSAVDFIRTLYSRFKIDVVYACRAVNSKADKRGKIAEVIIRNY
jgi:DNA adenine methylase